MLHPVGDEDILQHEEPELPDQLHRLDEVVVVVLLRLKQATKISKLIQAA